MPSIEDTVCSWCSNRPLTVTDMIGVTFNFFKYIHNDVKVVGKTASWLVIFSSINICFPDLLRKLRDGQSFRGMILRCLMYCFPLVVHSVFWTQYVHLCTFLLTKIGLSTQTVVQWTTFITGMTSLAYLYLSLWLTGIVEGPPFPWNGNGRFTRKGQGTVCTRLRLDTGLQLECCAESTQRTGLGDYLIREELPDDEDPADSPPCSPPFMGTRSHQNSKCTTRSLQNSRRTCFQLCSDSDDDFEPVEEVESETCTSDSS